MSPPVRTGRAAFTLIELLTVIAIIGILAAIVIPVTGRVRASARAAQCASNLRQVGLAIRLHADDNRGRLPGPLFMGQSPRYFYSAGSGSVTSNLAGRLRDYLPGVRPDPEKGANNWIQPALACPGWQSAGGADKPSPGSSSATSYLVNLTPWPGNLIVSGGNNFHPFGNSNNLPAGATPRRLDELSRLPLSRTWMLVDADNAFAAEALGYGSSANYVDGAAHGSGRNTLFFDGHVESLTPVRFMARLN